MKSLYCVWISLHSFTLMFPLEVIFSLQVMNPDGVKLVLLPPNLPLPLPIPLVLIEEQGWGVCVFLLALWFLSVTIYSFRAATTRSLPLLSLPALCFLLLLYIFVVVFSPLPLIPCALVISLEVI